MNKIKRIVSLVLVLCMVMAFLPVGVSAAQDDYAYNIVHVDAGRKYFSPENLKTIIDNAAAAGFNQVQLYLSDNQGFRFALDDMTLTTAYGTYDLTPALGDGYSQSDGKAPDGTNKYLTQTEMDEIIIYANGKGIDIVPCINVPGHMGAILEEFKGFRYSSSKSSIDLNNAEAVAFALALTEKYATYFASRGCKFYCVGADEYANDLSSMGFEGMGSSMYTKFVQFLNDAADIITGLGMTPRAFNDGFYYSKYSVSVKPTTDYEIYYWSSGWNGYNLAKPDALAQKGYKMINTNGGYYWILGGNKCSASKAAGFSATAFEGGTVNNPAGSMFCIWCDNAAADSADNVVSKTADVIAAFGKVLPQVESLVSGSTTEPEEEEEVTLTDASGVSVAAPGLTDLTVTEAEAPAIEGASKVLAWDMAPETANDAYTGAAEVSVPVPADWNADCMGAFVVNADGTVELLSGTYADGFYTYNCPHFSVTGIYEAAPAAAEDTITKTVTLEAGGTFTETISGYAYSADKSDLDESVATVNVVSVPGQEASVTYTAVSGLKCGDLISSNATNQATNYYHLVNGSYYPVYATRTSSSNFLTTTYTYTWRYSADNGKTYTQIGNSQTGTSSMFGSSDDPALNFTPYTKSGTEAVVASTTVTINGVYPGTTTVTVGNIVYNIVVNYKQESLTLAVNKTQSFTQTSAIRGQASFSVAGIVSASISGSTVTFTALKVGTTVATVGDTKYTITVVAEDLSNVTPLTVEYWITNHNLTINGAKSMRISAQDAYSETGVEIATLIPASGELNGNDTVLWKTTRLDSNNKQTGNAGDDETMDGTDFTYIRYYGGAWAYSVDGQSWTNVLSSDQIVAYYLQVTKVTDEITTQVVDYGVVPSTSYGDSLFVLLDFAVKYESGEMTPSTFPTSKTIGYHCNSKSSSDLGNTVIQSGSTYYRKLGAISAVETAEYEVYMITLTPTSDTSTKKLTTGKCSSVTSYTYSGTEKVVWVDDEANLGKFAAAELKYTSPSGRITYTVGGEPNIAGLEIYQNQGMLVTYYVRAKVTEDSLTVHYMDKTADVEFYNYNIAVKEGTFFKEGIALPNPWKGNLVNGDVTNFYGRPQYVSSDLSTLSQVGAQYLYSDYKCVEVKRSADGKHVYLYYTFDSTVSFVVDFSLPLDLTAADLSDNLNGVSIQDISFTGTGYTTYGRLTDNGTTITYQPTKIMNGADNFYLEVTTAQNVGNSASNKITYRVYMVPATTMHYEESFMTLTGFEIRGTANAGKQETELAGTKKQNYGFTTAYNTPGATNGTEAVSVINGTTATASAEFTFTGDGVEVYVNANADSGTLLALFRKNANGTESLTKLLQVDTAAQSGSTTVTGGQGVESYNLPVISVNGLDYGTYRIQLMHTGAGDDLGQVRLDGFRVFNTMGNLKLEAYKADERTPSYLEVRDEVLTALNVTADKIDDEQHYIKTVMSQVLAATNGELNGALYLSNGQTVDAVDLLNNGPKNELFLRKGESVSFNLGNATAQIGLKALNGQVSYTINDVNGTINTSADMFYGSYTGEVTIVNTGDNILSVTKLKMFSTTGTAALEPISEELVTHALQNMGIIEKPAPVNPFVDVAEGSFYYDAVLWAVGNGITTGADATHFLPDAVCQRASVVTFLWRAAGSPEPVTTVNPFVDVQEDHYFYKAVLWALENGITTGVDATHFAPLAACNRAQVVTFLWRAEGSPAVSGTAPFADVAEGQWYTAAVLWAVENGITNGMSANTFGVENACNRAQIVTFLYRASK